MSRILELMVTLPRKPVVSTLLVNVRCTGHRKDGSICNQLLFKGTITAFESKLSFKCPRCGEVAIFT